MAVMDVKSSVSSITAGAYWNVQPGSGETWRIHEIGCMNWVSGTSTEGDGYPYLTAGLYNGTNWSYFMWYSAPILHNIMMQNGVMIGNSVYLRIYNPVGTQDVSYNGIQIK